MQAFPYENLTATTTIPIQAKQRKLLSVAFLSILIVGTIGNGNGKIRNRAKELLTC